MPLPKICISISEEDRAFLDAHPPEEYPDMRPSYIFRMAMKKIKEAAIKAA